MEIARGVWQLSGDTAARSEIVAAVTRRAGRPPDETSDDGTRHVWRSSEFLTRQRVVFDESERQVTRVVEGSPLLRVAGWVGVAGVLAEPIVGRGYVWLGALALVTVHGMFLSTISEMSTQPNHQLVSYEVIPELFVDFGVVVAVALTVPVINLVWKATLVAGFGTYLFVHVLQGSIRLEPFPTDCSRAAARFRLPAVTAASVCFAVVSYELVVLATRAAASAGAVPRTVYAVAVVSAVVFGGYATLTLYGTFETHLREVWGRSVDDSEPKRLRGVGGGLFLGILGATGVVTGYVADLVVHGTTGRRLFPWLFDTAMMRRIPDAVTPIETAAVLPLQLVAFAPLVVTWLLSVQHLAGRVLGRAVLLRRATPLCEYGGDSRDSDRQVCVDLGFTGADDTVHTLAGLDSPPTVLVTERSGVTARPARTVRGEPVVVVHADLLDTLGGSSDRLTAIVAHEAVHLADDDRAVRLLATLATVLPGVGPNAVRAFRNYAAVERRADDTAVTIAGRAATMEAIRIVSDYQDNSPTERYRGLTGPEFVGPTVERLRGTYAESFTRLGVRRIRRRLAVAYYVVYGRAVFDAVHAPVETRLQQIEERTTNDTDDHEAVDESDQRDE